MFWRQTRIFVLRAADGKYSIQVFRIPRLLCTGFNFSRFWISFPWNILSLAVDCRAKQAVHGAQPVFVHVYSLRAIFRDAGPGVEVARRLTDWLTEFKNEMRSSLAWGIKRNSCLDYYPRRLGDKKRYITSIVLKCSAWMDVWWSSHCGSSSQPVGVKELLEQ